MGEPPHLERGQHNPNPLPKPLFSTKSSLQVEPGQAEPVLCVLAPGVSRRQARIANHIADPPAQHRVLPPSQGHSMVFWGTSRQSSNPPAPTAPCPCCPCSASCLRAVPGRGRGRQAVAAGTLPPCPSAWLVCAHRSRARLTWAVAAVLQGSLGSASPRVAASQAVCEGTRRHSLAMGLAGLR